MEKIVNKFQETASVIEQIEIAPGIFSMWLKTKNIAEFAKPGQFIAIYSKDASRLLPRPISICEIDAQRSSLRIVYRIAGEGTREFSTYVEGTTIQIMGPLGNGFSDQKKKALLIGGGIGIPPMLELAKQLNVEKEMMLGYRSELFLTEEFERYGVVYVATEDGSSGTKGTVIDGIVANQIKPEVIYACGPTPMLRAIKQYAREHNIECYVSLEEKMACGIGACLGCVCKSKEVDIHTNIKNKRICKEGPIFNALEVEI